jgi:signal transduction histidine kinase
MIKQFRTGFLAILARRAAARASGSAAASTASAAPGPRARQWLTDVAVAVVVIGLTLGSYFATRGYHHDSPPMDLAGYLCIVIGGLSLVARRRYPVAVLCVNLVTSNVPSTVHSAPLSWLSLIVAFFAAVRLRRRAAAIASLVIGFLASVWPPWLIGSRGHTSASFALGLLCGLLVLLTVAEVMRAAAERRLAANRIREQELLRKASEERMRIARDLHDVVAHNISVINVQANTALHLSERQPERAREALATINDVSKQALAELRSVLGILRADGDESAPRAPAPGLGRMGGLAATMAAAGLKVDIETEGSPFPLPASADLAAYRIIQEALTNSARHSGGTRATVRVRYLLHRVEVEVDDEGGAGAKPPRPAGTGGGTGGTSGTSGTSIGTGSGIAGMTDRAQALGGWLKAGPRADGGFRVTAMLPVSGGGE